MVYSLKHQNPVRLGFTLIELLVVMSIIALLLSILMPALGRARGAAMILKDASRLRSVHAGWIMFAPGNNQQYPTPGLTNRLSFRGQEIKGRGGEDKLKNDTGNVHSLSVMENLYNADALISDNEPNHNVAAMEMYDYSARNVPEDTYWDGDNSQDPHAAGGIEVDLAEGGVGCNVSYASIPLIGERKKTQWNSSGTSDFAIMSNRGPKFGSKDNRYSITYNIFGGGRAWVGNVCWNDNHITYEETLYPRMSVYKTKDGSVNDNLFNIDCVPVKGAPNICHFWGGDTLLVLVSELTAGGNLYPYHLNAEFEWDDQ